jgi:hypothetical protein
VYYFAVVGPSGVSVPVTISANSSTSQPQLNRQNHFTSLFLGGPLSGQYLGYTCLNPGAPVSCSSWGGEQQSFAITTPVVLESNTEYNLQLMLNMVFSSFVGNGPDTVAASGFIDPIITIDPTFALRDQFHLEFSTGVGNSAVPLPAALPLFATGLGLLGLLGWRRKRAAAA